MAGMMLAWDAAIDYHNSLDSHWWGGGTIGGNDPERHKPWNLVPYQQPELGSTLPKYWAFLTEVCGCSDKQQRDLDREVDEQYEQFFEEISDRHNWSGWNFNPLHLIIPKPVKVPILLCPSLLDKIQQS
jgi:hypothetical protein